MFHDVLVSLRAAAEFAPANIPLRLTLAQTLLNEQMFKDAETEYKNIIEVAPYSTDAKCGLAKVSYLQGDHAMASRILKDVCKEQETKGEFHVLLAKILLREHEAEEAKFHYQLGVSKDPAASEPGLDKLFA
jgi:transitional endoplasmic reticulum ATPase